jgi:hypothetical protein
MFYVQYIFPEGQFFFYILKQWGVHGLDLLCFVYVAKLYNILLSASHVTILLAPIILTLRQQAQGLQ